MKTGSCTAACCSASANCPSNIRCTSSSSSASLLGNTWKNELCPMPAALEISVVVVFVYPFSKNSATAARSRLCRVSSPLGFLPLAAIARSPPCFLLEVLFEVYFYYINGCRCRQEIIMCQQQIWKNQPKYPPSFVQCFCTSHARYRCRYHIVLALKQCGKKRAI